MNIVDDVIVPGKYIVTLRDAATVESHITWVNGVHSRSLSKRDGRGVNRVWKNNFKGYSGEFDEATVGEILQSEDVCDVHIIRDLLFAILYSLSRAGHGVMTALTIIPGVPADRSCRSLLLSPSPSWHRLP